MVLESLLDNTSLETSPLYVFLLGLLYSSIGVLLSMSMFPEQASLVMVFFTVFAAIHFVYRLIQREEHKEILFKRPLDILREHSRAVFLLMMLFLGFFCSFTFWMLFLPVEISNKIFITQLATINTLNAAIQGDVMSNKFYWAIVANNFKVMLISIMFSFLYGVGAIFILTWNASVGGAFIGNFIKQQMLQLHPLHAVLVGLVRYMPHGFLEMMAYFMAALGGSILSFALIHKDLTSSYTARIFTDFILLVALASLTLIVAGFVEIYITPYLVYFLT